MKKKKPIPLSQIKEDLNDYGITEQELFGEKNGQRKTKRTKKLE